jgi:ABC-type antimicrobial peptide transport system ATPase subunit
MLDLYARASAQRAESLFDKTIDIACKMPDVNRARLVVDTIKWVAGKLNPHKYSDKQTINIIGNVNQNITALDPDDRNKKILELMQKAGNIIDISPE